MPRRVGFFGFYFRGTEQEVKTDGPVCNRQPMSLLNDFFYSLNLVIGDAIASLWRRFKILWGEQVGWYRGILGGAGAGAPG